MVLCVSVCVRVSSAHAGRTCPCVCTRQCEHVRARVGTWVRVHALVSAGARWSACESGERTSERVYEHAYE